MTSEQYMGCIEAAKEYIRAGDIFQVVLSQRYDFAARCRALRRLPGPTPVESEPVPVLLAVAGSDRRGASPEPMVRLRDGVVISRPIAGSRPRGENEAHDRLLEGELAEDPKELAEHIMLVDLARNDVGRVVRFGTEKVDELMTIERYSHIMHITSQVSGELAEGKGPIDVLRATLAGGDPLGGTEGAGHGDHRRARGDQARRLRRRRGLHRLLGQRRHRDRHPHHGGDRPTAGPACRPAPGSSRTATRCPRTRNARTRPVRSWWRSRRRGA